MSFHHSACPHDCPSTCALEVEKLDAHTIGRVRGARDNSYTAGSNAAVPKAVEILCQSVGTMRWTKWPMRFCAPSASTAQKRCGRISTPAPWAW